jgi:PIN domain nuclease of toxin-antitoxin system
MTDLLIDTHVFLWWQWRAANLAPAAVNSVADSANRVFVSAASIWEISIKAKKGKLQFSGSAAQAVADCGFFDLPIQAIDAEVAGSLDWDHPDPFDRVLIAQARRLGLVLVTADKAIRRYGGVAQLWAGA